jgi:hypothetical protein
VSADDILLGLGLVIGLALACRLVAERTRLPRLRRADARVGSRSGPGQLAVPAHRHLLDFVPTHAEGSTLFSPELTYPELSRRFADVAQLVAAPPAEDGPRPLFVVTSRRRLLVAASAADTAICLAGPS